MAQGINPDRMFDKRVVQRNIRTGRATKKDYEAFVSALPDLSNQIRPADDGGDDDGFDVREARAQARSQPTPRPSSPFGEAAPAAPPSPAPAAASDEPMAAPPTTPTFGSEPSAAATSTPSAAPASDGSDPFSRSDTD
jgi:hypothetical protein